MKTTYVLDTNTISYFLRGEGNVDIHYQSKIIESGNNYAIPFIVVYEIRRWLDNKPTKQIKLFAEAFNAMFQSVKNEAEMTADVWDKAVEIYIELKQKGQLIGDADILIAAYCLVNDYTLVTRNINDFSRIGKLKLVNWYKNY